MAVVPYVCLKYYDGGPPNTCPIPHVLPSDGTIPDGTRYWQHERMYLTTKQEREDVL